MSLDRLAASRFLTISFMLHLLLVLASSGWVLYEIQQEKPGFQAEGPNEFLLESTDPSAPAPANQSPAQTPLAPSPLSSHPAQTSRNLRTITSLTPVSPSASSSGLSITTAGSLAMMGGAGGRAPLSARSAVPDESFFNKNRTFGSSIPSGAASTVMLGKIRESGRRLLFLLDASGSMVTEDRGGKAGYARLKQELIEIIDGLEPSTEFNVLVFDRGADVFKPQAVPATGDIRSEFRRWLQPYMEKRQGLFYQNYSTDRLAGYQGSTRLDLALTGAFEMGADVIFILTDGVPEVYRPRSEGEMAEAMKAYEQAREKNAVAIAAWEQAMADYKATYADSIAAMRKELQRRNQAVEGRVMENQHWIEGYQGLPPRPIAPPGAHQPWGKTRFTQEELVEWLNRLVVELYQPAGLARPHVHVLGYEVTDRDRDWLQALARGFGGRYRNFTFD